MAISNEQLFAAADALADKGEEPTLDSVRQALGVTTTELTDVMSETEAMNAWRTHRATKTPASSEPVPRLVAERVTQFSDELWGLALKLADERLAPERKALEAARLALEAKAHEARVELTALRTQLGAANEVRVAAVARSDETAQRATDLNAELIRVNRLNHELVTAIKVAVGIVSEV